MTTTTTSSQDRPAGTARAAQFADIDALLHDLAEYVDELKATCENLDPRSWAYTGRGSDLARIQYDLRAVMGIEEDGPLPGCDR